MRAQVGRAWPDIGTGKILRLVQIWQRMNLRVLYVKGTKAIYSNEWD
jgi:hypothetical protein